jgi:hypothetical protein
MAKAICGLPPAAPLSKLDATDWTRATWYAAYSQARRQLRPSPRFTVGARFPWTMDALRNRFGASGYAIAQQAARLAFDRATAARGYAGTAAQLQRQGLVDRTGGPARACIHVERYAGACVGWAFDPLCDLHGRRADRRYRVRQRRATAAIMAEDRFSLTVAGVLALREAEAARA